LGRLLRMSTVFGLKWWAVGTGQVLILREKTLTRCDGSH
jgi:hypothetical protein